MGGAAMGGLAMGGLAAGCAGGGLTEGGRGGSPGMAGLPGAGPDMGRTGAMPEPMKSVLFDAGPPPAPAPPASGIGPPQLPQNRSPGLFRMPHFVQMLSDMVPT